MIAARSIGRRPARGRAPVLLLCVVSALSGARAAQAQTYGADARRIGLGGVGDSENVAAVLIDPSRQYGALVLPFGLLQILSDRGVFDPDSAAYDPVLAAELASNPLHYTLHRSTAAGGQRFVTDLVHGRLDRDLNRYRGFTPASGVFAEGRSIPEVGRTFALPGRWFHGIYAGGGAYITTRNDAATNEALTRALSSGVDTYLPGAAFALSTATTNQLALAGTVGYRARVPLPAEWRAGSRGGVYVAGSLHVLRGLWLDDFRVRMAVTSDEAGLITDAAGAPALAIERITSTSGIGMAVDVGGAVVFRRWQFGAGANGLGNRITWRTLDRERYARASVLDGGGYTEIVSTSDDRLRLSVPVDYTIDAGYHADRWSALAEYGTGLMGSRLHAGVERRFRHVEVRAGARLSRDRWHPSAGIGLNLRPDVGLDAAIFGYSTGFDQRRQTAVAVSLRFTGLNR